MINDLFIERHPRKIELPLGLHIGLNVWGERRFWITLSNDQVVTTCQCGAKIIIGARVFVKIPFSKRYSDG